MQCADEAARGRSTSLADMKILLTGSGGMLGHDLRAVLTSAGEDVALAPRQALDVTSEAACREAVREHDVVVNAAAWTKVDDAEAHEGAAFSANAVGAANIARACAEADVRLVHISTDYVFAGDAATPYREDATLAPRSAYGRTKAAGEWAVRAYAPGSYVVRTAWLYGEHGPNFIKTMARLARERETVSVVADQRGQPTWTVDLAEAIHRLLTAGAPAGTYHGTSTGETTWFGLAQEVFRLLGHDPARVLPTTTAAFPRPAPRPAYSVLAHDRWEEAGVTPLPRWDTSLRRSVHLVTGSLQ